MDGGAYTQVDGKGFLYNLRAIENYDAHITGMYLRDVWVLSSIAASHKQGRETMGIDGVVCYI